MVDFRFRKGSSEVTTAPKTSRDLRQASRAMSRIENDREGRPAEKRPFMDKRYFRVDDNMLMNCLHESLGLRIIPTGYGQLSSNQCNVPFLAH